MIRLFSVNVCILRLLLDSSPQATITYLTRKLENESPKNPHLPQEVTLSVLHCLQRVLQQSTLPDGFPISQDVKDHIHHLVSSHLPPASILPTNNSLMNNTTPMMGSSASMMGNNTSILSNSLSSNSALLTNNSSNQLLTSSSANNAMLPNTNSMSSNILGSNNMGLGGMTGLQNKIPQLMSQNSSANQVSGVFLFFTFLIPSNHTVYLK